MADQSFGSTKSLGILNLSLQLGRALSRRAEVSRFDVFSNTSLHHWHSTLTRSAVNCFDSARSSRIGRIAWDQTGAYSQAARSGVDWLVLPRDSLVHAASADAHRDVCARRDGRLLPPSLSAIVVSTRRLVFRANLAPLCGIRASSSRTASSRAKSCSPMRAGTPDAAADRGRRHSFRGADGPGTRLATESLVFADRGRISETDLAIDFMQRWQARVRTDMLVDWVGRFPGGLPQPEITGWSYHTRLDEASYQRLLGRARVVVYVSEYEGFGMPPIEAVLHGACPVYSALPATPRPCRRPARLSTMPPSTPRTGDDRAWSMETAEIQQLAPSSCSSGIAGIESRRRVMRALVPGIE